MGKKKSLLICPDLVFLYEFLISRYAHARAHTHARALQNDVIVAPVIREPFHKMQMNWTETFGQVLQCETAEARAPVHFRQPAEVALLELFGMDSLPFICPPVASLRLQDSQSLISL